EALELSRVARVQRTAWRVLELAHAITEAAPLVVASSERLLRSAELRAKTVDLGVQRSQFAPSGIAVALNDLELLAQFFDAFALRSRFGRAEDALLLFAGRRPLRAAELALQHTRVGRRLVARAVLGEEHFELVGPIRRSLEPHHCRPANAELVDLFAERATK